MTRAFPQTMDFAGFNAPSRIEADIYDLIVEGEIPTRDRRPLVSRHARSSISALL